MYSDGTSLAVIPAGFTVSGMASENKISSGLVIYKGDLSKADWEKGTDASGNYIKRTYNQYVWIPCSEEEYKRTEWEVEADGSPAITRASKDETTLATNVTLSDYDKDNGITSDILNEIVNQISSEKNSVKKYGGFYIGRYEVGEGNVITQYKEPSASLIWSKAYENAKNIDVGTATRLPTGVTTAKCNIYDMGGNVGEYTTELNPLKNGEKNDTVVLRGGCYYIINFAAGARWDDFSAVYYSYEGFRTTLFIK